MKKYVLLIGIISILVTGCTSKSDNTVKSIAWNLAVASANNNNEEMVKLGNDLLKENATPKEIIVNNNCYKVVYTYKGRQDSVEYCK